jgi:hypothetical protein
MPSALASEAARLAVTFTFLVVRAGATDAFVSNL